MRCWHGPSTLALWPKSDRTLTRPRYVPAGLGWVPSWARPVRWVEVLLGPVSCVQL